MSGGELLQVVVDALPTADPVGAIVAALWRHDHTINRLVTDLARATGRPETVIRLEHGLPTGAPDAH